MVKLFVTGASGFIGTQVVIHALKAGHSVRGLARSEQSAQKVRDLGAEPVLGNLDSLEVLAEQAKKADAVIHLAFIHDFTIREKAINTELNVIAAITEALAGTNKTFIGCSGSANYGDTGDDIADENSPIVKFEGVERNKCEEAYVEAASRGVRTAVFRLSMHVYGRNAPANFIAMQTATAKKDGVARYIGEGSNETTMVHVDDAAAAFLLAAVKPFKPGTIFNIGDKYDVGVTGKKIPEAIAGRLSLTRLESVSLEEAAKIWPPLLAWIWSIKNRYSSELAGREFGWYPQKGRSALKDIVEGGRASNGVVNAVIG